MTTEEIAIQEYENVGDEKLFPNHTDKDIWISGFISGYEFKQNENMANKMVKQYVAGFLFSEDKTSVALILKERPDWQRGKLNGIGGKVEDGEHIYDAMRREFLEETGVNIDTWEPFCNLSGNDSSYNNGGGRYDVFFYKAFNDEVWGCKTQEDEVVAVYSVQGILDSAKIIPNLKWLIPLALEDRLRVTAYEETYRNAPIDNWFIGNIDSTEKQYITKPPKEEIDKL